MPQLSLPTGLTVEYETFGNSADPALLLISGFSAQLTSWHENLCRLFAAQNFHVIRFDNRDCGLSTKLDGVVVDTSAVITAALMEEPIPEVPYTLSHMAADAIGVLDGLGIAKAHVMGASMGGMIAQTVAIEHPHRVLSLTSVMSQPGEPEVGQPTAEAMESFFTPPPTSREEYLDSSASWLVWHSKRYRDAQRTRAQAAVDFDRSFYPEGGPRQLAAIYASGRRAEGLAKLTMPTLVLHGLDDTLIAPDGGERTAEIIPGAKLVMLEDMGHDLPEPLWPRYVSEFLELTARV
ncbi:MAG: alpha/beta hydrolase [Ilumatobacteraceae bacterium]|nr:alpha/beta hydrolase [Ilumatobacteraceae bacterium]NQW60994.1 alpha/beta hydrolase [bacterium]